MCRMVIYKGPRIPLSRLVMDPPHSLVKQGSEAKEMLAGPLNADGFGVSWYETELGRTPALYRNTNPIWTDPNVSTLFPRIASHLFFAHVRAASDGMPVSITNTHPFVVKQFMFMHNGFIDGFREKLFSEVVPHIHPDLWPSIKGNTDAEHFFGLWLTHLANPSPSLDEQRYALQQSFRLIDSLAKKHHVEAILNVAISDGDRLLVSRRHLGSRKATLYICQGEPEFPDGLIIASEKLFDSPAWKIVPENSTVAVDKESNVVTIEQIE